MIYLCNINIAQIYRTVNEPYFGNCASNTLRWKFLTKGLKNNELWNLNEQIEFHQLRTCIIARQISTQWRNLIYYCPGDTALLLAYTKYLGNNQCWDDLRTTAVKKVRHRDIKCRRANRTLDEETSIYLFFLLKYFRTGMNLLSRFLCALLDKGKQTRTGPFKFLPNKNLYYVKECLLFYHLLPRRRGC